MNYKHLDEKKKAQIDILYKLNCSMREIGRRLHISHSTVSRYLNNVHKPKTTLDIHVKYKEFIDYLLKYYDWRVNSIEVCVYKFKKYHPTKPSVSAQQVYHWINDGKIAIRVEHTCYKRKMRNRKRKNGMMNHLKWNIDNKTVLPIRLRPKYIEKRDVPGHLEIDSIIGKRNEYASIISMQVLGYLIAIEKRKQLILETNSFSLFMFQIIYKCTRNYKKNNLNIDK